MTVRRENSHVSRVSPLVFFFFFFHLFYKKELCPPGCGLDFHKRCAFRLSNNCSRARRQVSTSLSLFPPRRPQSHNLSSQTSSSLEEVSSSNVGLLPAVAGFSSCVSSNSSVFLFRAGFSHDGYFASLISWTANNIEHMKIYFLCLLVFKFMQNLLVSLI